jgi:hypothetical protein
MRLPTVLAIVLAVLVGCVPESRPTETPDSATPSSPAASPSAGSATPDPSVSIEPTTEPVVTPTPSASASPSGATPSESVGPGSAAACSGSDKNRSFFMDAAKALPWTVYCAVLPSGWFVDSGEYRRAGGGRLEITYRGPGGARLELHEGAFCTAADGCVPSGIEVGEAPLGDQTGTLRATDEGGWALVVDGDGTISWLAIGSGMDENEFRGLAAAVVAVNG